MIARLKFGALVAVSSGAIWIASVLFQRTVLPGLTHAPGIDIVFLPSGVRLILLMVGGLYAAVGVVLGSLLLVGPVFGPQTTLETLALALGSGLFPYASLLAAQRLLGVSRNLENMKPLQLPLIALGVAAGSALLNNLVYASVTIEAWKLVPARTLAMANGDFTGSLLIVAIVYLALCLRRKLKR